MRNTLTRIAAVVCLLTGALGATAGEVTTRLIDQANEELARAGSKTRIVSASFFTMGRGVPEYRTLRTGGRWMWRNVSYVVDSSDMTTDVAPADAEAAVVRAYDTWNSESRTYLATEQVADDGSNFDVLDGTFHPVSGACLTLFDITSPNIDLGAGQIYPEADIVVGGWVSPDYFSKCFGSNDILGVTLTLADGDLNADGYVDNLYVEQFYNEGFDWVLTGAEFLSNDIDIESVVVHENGHALGLGHTGGPNANQPFALQPNGRVFDPEAIMNPGYLGGEKRNLFSLDEAALRSLYTRRNK